MQIMTSQQWKQTSKVSGSRRSSDLQRVDRALESWWTSSNGFGNDPGLVQLRDAIKAWTGKKGLTPNGAINSARAGAMNRLLSQVEYAIAGRYLVVGLWARHNRGPHQSIQAKLGTVRSILGGMRQDIHAAQIDSAQDLRGVFIAPEYFYAAPGAGQHMAGLSRDVERSVTDFDKGRYVQMMQGISGRFGDTLIVPGSVAWKKPMTARCAQEARAALQRGYRKGLGGMDYHRLNFHGGARNGQARDYVPSLQQKYDFADPSNTGGKFAMYNSAHAFFKGQMRYQYDKHGDFHEALGAHQNTVFVPGNNSGVKTLGGVTFGFEICLDHNLGILRNRQEGHRVGLSAQMAAPVREREIHVVCSDHVANNRAHMSVSEGGLYMHASTSQSETGLGQKIGGVVQRVMPWRQVLVSGHPLSLYRVFLPRKTMRSPARAGVREQDR